MPDIEFVLRATDEATPVIERVRQQLGRFNESYNAKMGGGWTGGGWTGGGAGSSGKASAGPSVSSPFGRGVLGGLASLTIIGAGVKAVLGKISQTLIQASPYLQAVTNEMKTAMTLYIRPYGDKLAKLLQPMSEAMIEDAEESLAWNEANPDAMPWMDPTLPGNKNKKKLLDNLGLNNGDLFKQLKKALTFDVSKTKIGKDINDWFRKLFKGSVKAGTASMSMSAEGGYAIEGDGPDSGWSWENIVAPLSNFGHWLMNSISSGIGDLSTTLSGFGTWLWEKITSPFSGLAEILGGFGSWLWTGITTSLSGVGASIGGFGAWLWESITGGLGTVGESIGGFGSWIWTSITVPLEGVGASISGFGTWLWSSITSGIGGLGETLGGFGTWLWSGITGGVGNLGSALGGFGSWLYNSITGALSGAWSTLSTIGSTLYTSISSALGNIGYEAYRALHNAIASLLNSIANIELPLVGKPFKGLLGTIPMLAVGGSVLRTGAAIVHEGENVLTKQQSQMMANGGMGMMSAPQVNIYGNVYGVDDLERAINEAIVKSQLGYSGYR